MPSFDYIERKTARGESYWTPTVEIVITTPTVGDVRAKADVDTGADRTRIPLEFMAQLGVDPATCDHLNVTGGPPAFAPPGEWFASLAGLRAPIRPAFDVFPRLCLGMDYLAHFSATFNGPARTLTLEWLSLSLPADLSST